MLCIQNKKKKNKWTLTGAGAGTLAFVTHAHTRLYSKKIWFRYHRNRMSHCLLFFVALFFFISMPCKNYVAGAYTIYIRFIWLKYKILSRVLMCTHVHRSYELKRINFVWLTMVKRKKGFKKLKLIIIGIHVWCMWRIPCLPTFQKLLD